MSPPAKKRTSSNDGDDPLWYSQTGMSHASILYAVTFFTSMIVIELILEGTQNAFSDFLGLPHAVTLFQFISCCALPIAMTNGNALRQSPSAISDLIPYMFLSLVAFESTCFKSLSARYVSFPTKVIFKSTKLIPTMMISTLFQPPLNISENVITWQRFSCVQVRQDTVMEKAPIMTTNAILIWDYCC
jgi:hypothetical protein